MSWTPTDFLWPAGGLAALWLCLPMILGVLGCTRYRTLALPPGQDGDPVRDEEYLFYHAQLGALGFEPLGDIEEVGYFLGFHYVKRIYCRYFVSHERGIYASLYQLFPGDQWRVLLSTLLSDGWLVQTSCTSSLDSEGEKYSRKGVTTRVVAEQLEAHLADLKAGWQEGDALAPIDLAALARRINQVNMSFPRSGLSSASLGPLVLALLFLGVLTGLGWLVSSGQLSLAPVGLLIGSLLFRPLMNLLLRWNAQEMRREDVEKYHKEGGTPPPTDGPYPPGTAPSRGEGVTMPPTDPLSRTRTVPSRT